MKWSRKIATVWGIPIKGHVSLLAAVLFAAGTPGITGDTEAIIGLLFLEICIFASITLHELGHSYVAIRNGCRVRAITLTFIGGIAEMEGVPLRPRSEFLMAVAGPAVSFSLGAAFLGIGTSVRGYFPVLIDIGIAGVNIVQTLGAVNLVLAVFNLLPAFPMDGGRVLRAWLTPQLGRIRATLVAVTVGRAIAVVLGLVGLAGVKAGLWPLMIIACFIFFAAGREYKLEELRARLGPLAFACPPDELEKTARGDNAIIGPPPYDPGRTTRARIESD